MLTRSENNASPDELDSVKASNPAGSDRRVALGLAEVGGHRDDGLPDVSIQLQLRRSKQLRNDVCGHLFWEQLTCIANNSMCMLEVNSASSAASRTRTCSMVSVAVIMTCSPPRSSQPAFAGKLLCTGAA